MSGNLKLNTALGGSIALTPTNTASNITVTIPATAGTLLTTATAGVPIGGPAFSASSATSQTGITSGVATKVVLATEVFDTNNCFASSRFTPTVAGYYQINGCAYVAGTNMTYANCAIFKNGSIYKYGNNASALSGEWVSVTADIVYLNGTTDYVELYASGIVAAGTVTIFSGSSNTYFSGALVRSAT